MTKILKLKSMILVLFSVILVCVSVFGVWRVQTQSNEVISNLSYSGYLAFTEGQEGAVGSVKDAEGNILWSQSLRGYEDTYNLVGELRDNYYAENVVTIKSKNILVNTEDYQFSKGVDSLSDSGKTIQLTLNHKLNKAVYDFMVQRGVTEGSAIFMNATTGEIAAAVSVPGTVPDGMNELPDGSLINKNFRTTIPGSTMKIPTTLLLSQMNENFCNEVVECNGRYATKTGVITCGSNWGTTSMECALGKSCNVFFATEINRYLDSKKEQTLQALENLNIYQAASDQKVDCLDKKGSYVCYNGDSSFDSTWSLIGEGEAQMSPVDMVWLAAGIVHHGNSPEPYLVDSVLDAEGNILEKNEKKLSTLPVINVDKVYEVWKAAYQDYYEAEKYGDLVTVAKTGTAEYETDSRRFTSKLLLGYMEECDMVFFIEIHDFSTSQVWPYEITKMLTESELM